MTCITLHRMRQRVNPDERAPAHPYQYIPTEAHGSKKVGPTASAGFSTMAVSVVQEISLMITRRRQSLQWLESRLALLDLRGLRRRCTSTAERVHPYGGETVPPSWLGDRVRSCHQRSAGGRSER